MVNEGKDKVWNAYSLALTLGYMVALPVVILGVGGVLLDKHFNSFPLFVIIGFILAMTVSLTTVYVKTKDIISMGTLKVKKNIKNRAEGAGDRSPF